MAAPGIEPFRIDIPDTDLADLHRRLDATRWPVVFDDPDWAYGTPRAYLEELCDHWRHAFDWRAVEADLNRLDQFRTVIDGQPVHFVHVRSSRPDAVPLILIHGWPGSFVEFTEVIGPLAEPDDSAVPAFHVVVPSLPGYGFSGPTTTPGWDTARIAAAFDELMGRLGYDRYGCQGGDWGSAISVAMARHAPDRVTGIHLNLVFAGPPPGDPDPTAGLTDVERARLEAAGRFRSEETGYQRIQSTKPHTLGFGLNDSPAGLAAWIVEKFRTWSDCDGDPDRRFGRDRLLTNISVYWFTGTITSACRLYREARLAARRTAAAPGRLETPTAAAIFPAELAIPPRRWAEAAYNLVRWTEMPRGGHFAAMEEPDLLVDDIRAFFGSLGA